MRHKRPSRRDVNEAAIIAALVAAGASVTQIDQDGVPDLLVGYAVATYLLEVKRPLGPRGGQPAGGKSRPGEGGDGTLTEAQIEWRNGWRGRPAVIVRTPEEALRAIGAVT